jgi:transposase
MTKQTTPTRKRRVHTPHFKFKVVLESIEKKDMSGTARRYGISQTLLTKWKQQLLADGHHCFATIPDKEIGRLQQRIGTLEQMVGKKEVELALLKNFSDFYASPNTS